MKLFTPSSTVKDRGCKHLMYMEVSPYKVPSRRVSHYLLFIDGVGMLRLQQDPISPLKVPDSHGQVCHYFWGLWYLLLFSVIL